MTTNQVSRRTVARAAMWAAPTAVIAGAAPAYASSSKTVDASICHLFYGDGSQNYQTHSVYLGARVNAQGKEDRTIPKGTTITWNVTASGGIAGGTTEVPGVEYSPTGRWTLTTNPPAGTPSESFTVTLTANVELSESEWACGNGPRLIWTDINSLRPGATVSISGGVSAGRYTGEGASLSYQAAKRFPKSVNKGGRSPHNFLSKSGTTKCWPSVKYSRLLTRNGYDNVTCYNGKKCTPAPNSGKSDQQYVTPEYCA